MKRPLMYAAGGFVLGEVCLLLPVGLRAGIPAMILAGVCYLWIRRRESGRSLLWWILPLFVMLGMSRFHMDRLEAERAEQIAGQVKEIRLKLEGEVADIREGGKYVSLKLSGITLYIREMCVDYPPVMVYVDTEEFQACRIRIGMRVSVQGELERFEGPGNPGEFDYGAYYHAEGIEGRMYGQELRITDENCSPYFDSIYRIKKKAVKTLEELCSPQDQGVFQAVVLGDKNGLLEDIRQLYQRNGISHLLAVSGVKTLKLGIPLVPETRINWAFVPLHIAIIYILKLCLGEEIIPRCRFPCSRGYLTKYINWQKKQSFSVSQSYRKS